MRSTIFAAACTASLLVLSTAPASAQPTPRPATLALDCRAENVRSLTDEEIGPDWLSSHPDRLIARIQPLTLVNAWAAALDSVIVRSGETLRFADSTSRDRYRSEFAETRRLFTKLLELPADAQPRFIADSLRMTRWQLSQSPATGSFSVFVGPNQIDITSAMSSEERRALCWPALSVHALLVNYHAPIRDSTVVALNALAARWDDYIDNSYSQLPWELFVNGLGRSRRDWNPPSHQWIVLHPSAGVELDGLSLKNLTRVDVAVVEPLGFVRYNSKQTRYYGVSTVATFASDRSAAVGGYLHLWYPQAKLGYVVRSDPDRKRRQSVLVTVDVYDLLSGTPKSLTEAKDAALALRKAQPAKP